MTRLLFSAIITVKNQGHKANYLNIRLKGLNGNTMAIGAKIELWNKGDYQFVENFLSRGYASSVDPVIHFGLSDKTSVDSIRVTWPASGNTSLLKNIRGVNQIIEIKEIEEIIGNTSVQSKSSRK